MADPFFEMSAQISAQNAVISAMLVAIANTSGFNAEGRQKKLDEILGDARKIIQNVNITGGTAEQADQIRSMSIDCIDQTFGKIKAL